MKGLPLFLILYLSYVNAYTQHNFDIALIPDSLITKKTAAVVRLDNTTIHINKPDDITIVKEKAITVLNSSAIQQLQFYLGYKTSSDNIRSIQLQYYDSNNKLIEDVKKKDFEDRSSTNGFSIITDYRIRFFEYNPSQYPITIYYKYETEQSNSFIRSWYPISSYNTASESSTFKIINNSEAEIIPNQHLLYLEDKLINEIDLSFQLKGIKPIKKEVYAAHKSIFPSIDFRLNQFYYEGFEGSIDSWNSIGLWRYKNLLNSYKNTKPIQNPKLESGLSNPKDKLLTAKEIYKYVQTNTRYVSISLKDGGLKPMDPHDVNDLKYGDCKALALYTQKLLENYSIESDYIVVQADNEFNDSFSEDYCSMEQGNHIIIRTFIDSTYHYLDCTMHDSPFGFLDAFTDNRKALAVNKEGGKIIETPDYDTTFNNQNVYIEISPGSGDEYNLIMINNSKGINYNSYKRFSRQNDEFYQEFYQDYFSNLKSVKHRSSKYSFDEDGIVATDTTQITFKNFFTTLGNYHLFPINTNYIQIPYLPKDYHRLFPIEFPRSYVRKSICKIPIPENYAFKDDVSYSIKEKYGEYKLEVYKDESFLIIERKFKLLKNIYPSSEYHDIKKFFDHINKQERLELTFQKAT